MDRSVKDQIKNGLYLGGGLGIFLIALIFLRSGLERIVWSHPPSHKWTDWVGWLDIGAASLLLLVTARVWLLLLAGCVLFAFGKGFIVMITGKNLYAPYGPFPRLEAAEITLFALATLMLMARFANTRPTILDRFALTFYVFVLAWNGMTGEFSLTDPWQVAGLVGLAICWCVFHWKQHTKNKTHLETGRAT